MKGAHHHSAAKRSVGQIVSATIDGQVASWTNSYSGPNPLDNTQPAAPSTTIPELSTATMGPSITAASPDTTVTSGYWSRQAYYNADRGVAEGLTFLNHLGTAAGGPAFGASLSYASSDGQSGATSPQTLSQALIVDNVEVIVMSNQTCNDGDCGYTRPGGVNYRESCPHKFQYPS